ncbi:hypothetical protein POSPLADRAFT_1145745, partial [Postia placenta MAD-698-R-SB12]
FYQSRGKVLKLVYFQSEDFDAFTEWCSVETCTEDLLILWKKWDAADALCSLHLRPPQARHPIKGQRAG